MVKRTTLTNGVRLLVEHIPHVRSVSMGIWVDVGSRDEPVNLNGMSHLVEHMMFKGTETRTALEIASAFDAIGAHVNAFTSKEYTCFYTKVLDDHALIALELLHDMFFNSTFSEVELAKEKQVIIEEIHMVEDTPDDLVHDLAIEAALAPHPLGRSILGSVSTINQFTTEHVKSFVELYYKPEKVVVTVAGSVNNALISRIKQLFDQFPERSAPVPSRKAPMFQANTIHRVKETEQAHMCIALPGLPINAPNIYSMALLNNIVGGSMSSRLFQDIREKQGLAYAIYSYHTSFKDSGLFIIYAGTSTEQSEKVFSSIVDNLREIRQNGITRDEFHKAKEQLKGNFVLGLESTGSRMSRLGKNELLLGRHPSQTDVINKINAVQWDEVIALAEQLFTKEMSIALISSQEEFVQSLRGNLLV